MTRRGVLGPVLRLVLLCLIGGASPAAGQEAAEAATAAASLVSVPLGPCTVAAPGDDKDGDVASAGGSEVAVFEGRHLLVVALRIEGVAGGMTDELARSTASRDFDPLLPQVDQRRWDRVGSARAARMPVLVPGTDFRGELLTWVDGPAQQLLAWAVVPLDPALDAAATTAVVDKARGLMRCNADGSLVAQGALRDLPPGWKRTQLDEATRRYSSPESDQELTLKRLQGVDDTSCSGMLWDALQGKTLQSKPVDEPAAEELDVACVQTLREEQLSGRVVEHRASIWACPNKPGEWVQAVESRRSDAEQPWQGAPKRVVCEPE